ncbi:MAG TPA: S1C family serine protease [Candidatus Tectomicrobia bacterium]|nr:S1C family serine protease [Candidatus Tectomicrobia bacterium]
MDVPPRYVAELLPTVVHLHARVPPQHPSTRILGDERMGSGVIIASTGLVLTVNYVVMGAATVEVTPIRGRRMKAEVVAQDFEVGLALLRVPRARLLPSVSPGPDRPLDRGHPVIAVASTGPGEVRVAGGVLTYLGEFEAYWEYLLERGLVSSAANPGFGGGGLFDLGGRLLGIVSLNLNEIARCSLAIPIEHYAQHADELLRHGRVVSRPRRAWLGVFAHALDEGVVVAGIVPDGPGDRGGLREGDLIVSLNAEAVSSRRELYVSLWRHEPGQRLTLEVMRDNRLRRIVVTGGDRADFFRKL